MKIINILYIWLLRRWYARQGIKLVGMKVIIFREARRETGYNRGTHWARHVPSAYEEIRINIS